MTLCLAWRDEDGHVHLASDSRVTVASNSFEDVAVKVTRIPCEIFPPSSSLENGTGVLRMSLGMAFAGSHLGAYVIKESLVEVLSRFQFVPSATEVSMDKIVKIAFHAYEKLSKKLCSTSIAKNGICEIFLVGFCPKSESVQAFKLSTDATTKHAFFCRDSRGRLTSFYRGEREWKERKLTTSKPEHQSTSRTEGCYR